MTDVTEPLLTVTNLSLGKQGEPRRLQGISFAADRGEFVALIGASGNGKSTLLAALAGLLPTSIAEGQIGDCLLSAPPHERAGSAGYVPQQDALHPQFTVGRELDFASQLRGASGDRQAEIAGLLAVLSISDLKNRRIADLSTGERRRVSVAVELIGRPRVLLLDEATTGLDPGHERDLMRYLRTLADQGCCVILATHSVTYLDLVDRVLVMGTRGRLLSYAAPQQLLTDAGVSTFVEVFDIDEPIAGDRATAHPPTTNSEANPGSGTVQVDRVRILVRREFARLLADRRTLAIFVLQAPVLGLIVRLMTGSAELGLGVIGTNQSARRMLLTLVLSAVWFGSTNSIRAIVGDRDVVRRERVSGVRASHLLIAKVCFLWPVVGVQVAVMTLIAVAGMRFVGHAPVVGNPLLALFISLWFCAGCAGSVALAISSFARSTDQALAILPLLLVPQLVLSGGVLALRDAPALRVISYAAPARWGMSLTASSTHLRALESRTIIPVPLSGDELALSKHEDADSGWNPDATAWSVDLGCLVLLSVLGAGAAGFGLRRP